jgi:ABC-type nitrate/sulfonate/bicarbonate transport system substrate-binding protein
VLRGLIASVCRQPGFRRQRDGCRQGPEKEQLKLGFIKLTDMAPLAIAYEKGSSKTKACTSRSSRRPTGKSCSIA